MKKLKSLAIALMACMLLVCSIVLTACGNSEQTYKSSVTFNDDNPAPAEILAGNSKNETTLVVKDGTYTFTKTSYGAEETDSTYLVSEKWYTSYKIVYQYVFTGTCTVDGDKINLSVPSSATKLAYMEFDVHALYPSRFPIAPTVAGGQSDIATTTTDVITLSATDGDMIYFNGLYIQTVSASGEAAKAQTVTVSGETIVSVE